MGIFAALATFGQPRSDQASLELLHIETECDFGLYRRTEHKSTPQGVLRGAFSGPPTPLKDIPKRNGESRAAGIGLMGGVAGRLFGPDHSVLSSGPTGDDAHGVRQSFFHRIAIWRCTWDEPLCPLRRLAVCMIAITVVYVLILPTLLLVPQHLTATTDGQTPEPGFAAD
jgi:hypothetical protein